MFEQSMLLPSAPRKKAEALAVSLGMQVLAVGALLLIPLFYTDRLPFAPLQLPTFLPPRPPRELPKPDPLLRTQTVPRMWHQLVAPTTIPPLIRVIDDMDIDLAQARIDSGSIIPPVPSMISIQAIPPPPPPQVAEPAPSRPITVTSDIQSAKLIRKVVPLYPRIAIAARISGTVRLIGTVATDGTVQQIQVVTGPPLLVKAAVEAVRQWLYRPTLLNNKPVEVIAPIDVIFTLSQ
jgi:periplasmic protein TonB